MEHFEQTIKKFWILIGILLFGIILGLYQLDSLPAEMWGDATTHYSLAQFVQSGNLFFNYRFGGDGPIYTYLVVAISWLIGLSFYTLKFTSVLIYLCFIIVMYFLSDELFKKKEITYITTFLSTVSFWSLTFARQPHARMLVPLFVAATTLYALKKKNIISGILLGIGMYSQASFWAMPLVFWRRFKILFLGILITLPLVELFAHGTTGFFTNQSYFGEKLAVTDNLTFSEIIHNVGSSIHANFFSFITRGDSGFRLNVPLSPHIDFASMIFFFIGFVLLVYQSLKEKRMRYIEFVILPIILIQIPSLLDIHNPLAQPNIGRMVGIIPFVYMATAYGMTVSWHHISTSFSDKKTKKIVYYFCISYLLLIISFANIYKFFVIYPKYLPDQNTPYGRIIAKTIDASPLSTVFYVLGSNWGQWGQPEQHSITDSLTTPHIVNFLPAFTPTSNLCVLIKNTKNKLVFITSPNDIDNAKKLSTCGRTLYSYHIEKNSFQVANVIKVK
ncbi:MAG TPA: hypothetical protein VLF93_03795 [Candidatus Saccharimonadales bacterium]|nr:hypothetical protein [Candidatus Saccharimonadales bacterium]